MDRRGLKREFRYDEAGYLTQETWFAQDLETVVDTLTFSYTTEGLLESAANHTGTYSFIYDTLGQLTTVVNPFGVALTFGYDDAGNRTSVEDSFGAITTSEFDGSSRMISRTYSQPGKPTLHVEQDYDEYGRLIEQRRYNHWMAPDTIPWVTSLVAVSTYEYDDEGRLIHLLHEDANETVLAEYDWEYDAGGRLISQSDHGVSVDYDYDELGQLINEDDGESEISYEYDAAGNRDMSGYDIGTGNRLLSDGVWDYTYDDEGNVAKKERISDGLTWTYGWDQRNQLIWAEKREEDEGDLLLRAEYDYDPFGNRIEKRIDSDGDEDWDQTQRYVLDGWNPAKAEPVGNENWDVVLDLDGSNAEQTRYLRGDGVDELLGRVEIAGTTAPYWYLVDHLGSIRDVIDEDGDIRDSIRYDGFGNIIEETNAAYRGRYAWVCRPKRIYPKLGRATR